VTATPAPQLSDVFIRVLEAAPEDRPTLLRTLCRDRPDWIATIEQLVAASARAFDTTELATRVFDEPAPLPSGTRIGSYVVEGEIARGGMGIVYRAHDAALDMPVAIKALKPEIAHDSRQLARLREEARVLARLSDQRHIARVYAFLEQDGHGYIVQELVTGETLRERLTRGPLPIEDALDAARAILEALATAHHAGIVHRDLKPENVMRTETGVYKVLDFGIASRDLGSPETTLRRQLTGEGQVVGTLSYMSPEQLLGQPVDARSDLFTFGVVLYELLTCRNPFARSGDVASWSAILGDVPAPLTATEAATIPAYVHEVVQRCLEKSPERRWPSAESAAAALAAKVTPRAHTPAERHVRPAAAAVVRWWQFHQAAAAISSWLLLVAVWRVRHSITALDWRAIFYVLVAVLCVVPSLRLSLWFVSAHQPGELRAQHARYLPWIRAGEAVFAALLVVTGLAVSWKEPGWATLLIAFGLGSVVVSTFVEPLTSRASFAAIDEAIAASAAESGLTGRKSGS
jgi:hypothetical protein